MRTIVALTAALVAAFPTAATAGELPQVGIGSCYVEATNGTAECYVQLDPNSGAVFVQITSSGYGSAELYCYVSNRSMSLGGGYGTSTTHWSHSADVCRLMVRASNGTSSAYVD